MDDSGSGDNGARHRCGVWLRLRRLQELLHPQRRLDIALASAEDLLSEGAASRGRLEFALAAGELALSRGRFLLRSMRWAC